MPYQRLAETVLAEWRDVERGLAEIPPDWPEPDYSEALKLESYRLVSSQRGG